MTQQTVGITGTRETDRITGVQIGWLWDTLKRLREHGYSEFHHGDCIGADYLAHYMALGLGYHVVVHPPLDPKYRAFCIGGTNLAERPYLDRNKDIVDASDPMLALPSGPEKLRSGTWSTVRYTEGVGKFAHGCLPDGVTFTRALGYAK